MTATSSAMTTRGDLDPLGLGQLGRDLEVHDVAGVVLDDVQHARAAVDRLGGGQHLVRDRRGEDRARAGGIQHAHADEAAVHRLVAGAAAGDDADLALVAARPCGRRRWARSTRIRSAWAAAIPASASSTTAVGLLMSFFIAAPLPAGLTGQTRAAPGDWPPRRGPSHCGQPLVSGIGRVRSRAHEHEMRAEVVEDDPAEGAANQRADDRDPGVPPVTSRPCPGWAGWRA